MPAEAGERRHEEGDVPSGENSTTGKEPDAFAGLLHEQGCKEPQSLRVITPQREQDHRELVA